jgi:hypothetical protein
MAPGKVAEGCTFHHAASDPVHLFHLLVIDHHHVRLGSSPGYLFKTSPILKAFLAALAGIRGGSVLGRQGTLWIVPCVAPAVGLVASSACLRDKMKRSEP